MFATSLSRAISSHWRKTLDTNLTAPALLSRALAKMMVARRSGIIVNVASCSAFEPEAGHTAYAASKAGLLP